MKPVITVFAHPDDEAFFTGGTIATFARDRDVYSICVTDGSAGENHSNKEGDITSIRKSELLAAAEVLGIKKTFFLDYKDGTLSNSVYHEVAAKIQAIIDELQPELLLTFEPRGITGHLDHIAISMITSFVFEKSVSVKELWYFCNTADEINLRKDYYIYWPPGYKKSEISKIVDVSPVWDQKLTAMQKHESQQHDVDALLSKYPQRPKEEDFIIITKETE